MARKERARETPMNETKQRVKGLGEQIKGKAREIGGAITGDTKEEVRGKYDQAKGKTRTGVANAVDDLEDATDTEI
jgi:uncharacterized protein YjbJ (UPF0337 family)